LKGGNIYLARYGKYGDLKRRECLKRAKQLKINIFIEEAKKNKHKYGR